MHHSAVCVQGCITVGAGQLLQNDAHQRLAALAGVPQATVHPLATAYARVSTKGPWRLLSGAACESQMLGCSRRELQ
jgi:hypothetical protein